MRTLIAIPCMDMVYTLFFTSMLAMRKPEGTEVAVASCSLIYEARHTLAKKAMDDGFDRVLWLDSDMTFQPDLLERFAADLDQGLEYVYGLFFTRKIPVKPCVYEICHNMPNKRGRKRFRRGHDDHGPDPQGGCAAVLPGTRIRRRPDVLPESKGGRGKAVL